MENLNITLAEVAETDAHVLIETTLRKILDNDMTYPYIKYFASEPAVYFKNLCKFQHNLINKDFKHMRRYKYTETVGYFVVTQNDYDSMNIVVDIFSEHLRLKCNEEGHDAPLIQWKKPEILRQIIGLCIHHYKFINSYSLHESIHLSRLTRECTNYKASVATSMCKLYKAKRVLDLSTGWGDRLIGCLAAGVLKYHGCDPNDELQEVYADICDTFKTSKQEVIIQCTTSQKYKVKNNYYDLFHSSPPFYTKEEYNGMDTKISLDEWFETMLYIYIRTGWNGLKKGGHMTIYIFDYGNINMCDRMNDYILQLGGTFIGSIGVTSDMKKFAPIWVWQK